MSCMHWIASDDKKLVFSWPALALALIISLGIGCDSGGGSHHHGDDQPPEVVINQPTDTETYSTGNASITIGGTATDNAAVDQVIWENKNGETKTGEATGTASWEAQIDLNPGSNTITVTAIDASGNTASDTLTVTLTTETYTLSGTITAASNSSIDRDVNDPNAPYTPNDSFEQAQVLSTPITLGGYINQPGTGEKGRSFADGDINDFFRVDLLAGESIILNIAAPILDADLDMYLYDAANFELLDSAIALYARTETLEALDNGTYMIQVVTTLGASNYTLTIGQVEGTENRKGLRLSRPFEPGEVIAEFAESHEIQTNAAHSLASLGLKQKAGGPGRAGLFSIHQASPENFVVQSGSSKTSSAHLPASAWMTADTREKLNTLLKIKSLRRRTDIEIAEPNYIHQAFKTPNDEYYPLQWHYPLINLPEAWDISTGSESVIVAVVDTGVIMDHPDLAGKITGDGFDFISDPDRALDGDGIDKNADDPGDESQGGSSFHGTHVAGTIAAATNNDTGVSGASWNARIMAIRALGKNSAGTTYDIMQGVRYAAGLENDSGRTPDEPAAIINLSIGGDSFSQAEQDVCTQAREAGVIIISAAGNSGKNAPSYPAAYDGVISVSAVGINANLAPYSNFGSTIDVAAPGGDFSTDLNADGYVDGILNTGGDDSSGVIQNAYTFYQGTSMAVAHMAGVVALMKSIRPGLTPDELDGFIQDFKIVRDIGTAGRDDFYGYGLIDARKAVLAARDGSVPTVLNISPATLSLGNIADSATLTASRVGSDTLSVTSISDDAEWLTVSALETDKNGLGTYTASVNRSGLSDGIYSATITFVSSDNTVNVPVNMRITSTVFAPNAGFHYVLLTDNETDETVAQQSLDVKNGLYEYRFKGVEAGKYQIYAGTDSDNDYVIGDAGEAIGAYLSTDQPTVLTVDSDRSELDFVTEFSVNIPEGQITGMAAHRVRNGDKILKNMAP